MAIRYGYSYSAWNKMVDSVRRDTNERNLKTIAAGGYEGVEFQVGTGRSVPFGRPLINSQVYGGAEQFADFLKNLGIDKFVAWDYDPAAMCGEENTPGRDTTDPQQHQGICDAVVPFAEYMQKMGTPYLVCRPVGSLWKTGPLADEKIIAAAECWNKVGAVTEKYGVKVLLHIDWFCAANSPEAIDLLMANTDPKLVGLCIDTAEQAMVGIDPTALYEKYADRTELFHLAQIFTTDTLNERAKPFAEDILTSGGERGIDRWYWELGSPDGKGLINIEKLMASVKAHDYNGWIIIESQQAPDACASALFNAWYVKNVLKKI